MNTSTKLYSAKLCVVLVASIIAVGGVLMPNLRADGIVIRPLNYEGSMEEVAQEAIIIFNPSDKPGEATEDLILKISVMAGADVKHLGWVVPLPTVPTIEKEDAKLFKELFDYVEFRDPRGSAVGEQSPFDDGGEPAKAKPPVEVLVRKIVGSFDVAVLKENTRDALNEWLKKEGFREIPDKPEWSVVGKYRVKGYVFACIKVKDAEFSGDKPAELHPLRFTFKTGGQDCIYFPMRLSSLQKDPFDVNLYVFSKTWLNADQNFRGFTHRGFTLRHRDRDSMDCVPGAGKAWSAPETDPYLKRAAGRIPTVKALFEKLHPNERYYLTNIQATGVKPKDLLRWPGDLWLCPHYADPLAVPLDAQQSRKGSVGSEMNQFLFPREETEKEKKEREKRQKEEAKEEKREREKREKSEKRAPPPPDVPQKGQRWDWQDIETLYE